MSKPYVPKPDSLADRVIKYLSLVKGPLSYAEIARQMNKPRSNIEPCLRAAITHGALVQDKRGSVRLPTPAEIDAATPAAAEASPRTRAGRKTTKARGSAGRRQANRHAQPAAPDEPALVAAPAGPVACLLDDGDIVLHGLQINTDETSCTISEAHARKLHSFLDRLFGTPVARPITPDGVYAARPVTQPLLTGEAHR